jgi:uncharacterized protein DUF3995
VLAAGMGTGTLRRTAIGVVAGLGAVHAVWATGSTWPYEDRDRLAAAVNGKHGFPGPGWCVAVAGVLFGAAALAAQGRTGPASAMFAARGIVGLARPDLLPAGDVPPFRRLNALLYSPGCLLLAVALRLRAK